MLSLRAQAFSVENLIRTSSPTNPSALDLTSTASLSVDQQSHDVSITTAAATVTAITTASKPVPSSKSPEISAAPGESWPYHRDRGQLKRRRQESTDSASGEEETPENCDGEKQPRTCPSGQDLRYAHVQGFTEVSGPDVEPSSGDAEAQNPREMESFRNSEDDASDDEEDVGSSCDPSCDGTFLSSRGDEDTFVDNNNNKSGGCDAAVDPEHNTSIHSAPAKGISYGNLFRYDPHLSRNERVSLKSQPPYCGVYRQPVKSGLTSQFCFCHGDVPCCGHPGLLSVLDCHDQGREVLAELIHADLWSSFHSLGTEMIITKSGRRMFPAFKVRLSGLDPNKFYTVKLDFLQPDSRKYRYIYHSSQWVVSGSGDSLPEAPSYVTQEGPISGKDICYQVVSFERLKLTNVENSRPGQVSLVSMQKFQPRVVVEEQTRSPTARGERFEIIFPQTSFIAVTAYQNQQITTLKIASNPFAKGFRDSGKTRPLLYPPTSFSLSSAWNCLPGVPGMFGFDQKGPTSADGLDVDMCDLEKLYKLKKLQEIDTDKERALRGKTYDYLYSLNNIHGRGLPAPLDISAFYSARYKHHRRHQATQHASYYHQHQQYLSYYSHTQQLLRQQELQPDDKNLVLPVLKTTNYDEASVLRNNVDVAGSAFEPPLPAGAPLRVPPLFFPFASQFYTHDSTKETHLCNVSPAKETHLSIASHNMPQPIPPAHSFHHVSRLSPSVEKTSDSRTYGHQPQINRHIESPLSSPRTSLGIDDSHISIKHRHSPEASSVISSASSDPSPIPSRHSPL